LLERVAVDSTLRDELLRDDDGNYVLKRIRFEKRDRITVEVALCYPSGQG
jgi:hypothetical protein